MGLTDDPTDPRLTYYTGPEEPHEQAEVYLVLSDEERAKGFVRPVRRSYIHLTCLALTTMGQALAETYARDPHFYGATYCCHCQAHFPVGEHGEFVWDREEPPFTSNTEYRAWLASGDKVGT
jgi:hypothetical protein